VYDGGVTKQQKAYQELNASVQNQEVEVELLKLKDRINQVYLGILFIDAQIQQVELIKADLQTGLKRVNAQLTNGTAFRSNVNTITAEIIKIDQRKIELQATRNSLLQTLSLFINQPLDSSTVLKRPVVQSTVGDAINRPEVTLFSNQSTLLGQQNKLIRSRNLPKTSLFVQGGYGRPGLNLLQNKFDLFYIGGIRFNWSLAGLYTVKNDRQIVKLNQEMVNVKRDVFLLNTRADISNQRNEIAKQQLLISSDQQIIQLRRSISESARAQLQNGVITASDYLREVNAEDQARQSLISHELQLLQAQIGLSMLTGM
jgi:outer membrane protein TolC